MKYLTKYKNLKEELVTDRKTAYIFQCVEECANSNKLELTNKDFKRFFNLKSRDIDIDWIMSRMSIYNEELTDVLISYLTY